MYCRKGSFGCACGVLFALVLGRLCAFSGQAAASESDFCGPRCVERILRWYGLPAEDLVDLIREIQGQGIEHTADIGKLEAALSRRGVYARAVRVPAPADLSWPYPAIVHLEPAEEGARAHFVLHLPESDESGPGFVSGNSVVPQDVIRKRASGAVLVSSREPLGDAESLTLGRIGFSGVATALCLAAAMLAVLAAGVYLEVARRRSRARSSPRSASGSGLA